MKAKEEAAKKLKTEEEKAEKKLKAEKDEAKKADEGRCCLCFLLCVFAARVSINDHFPKILIHANQMHSLILLCLDMTWTNILTTEKVAKALKEKEVAAEKEAKTLEVADQKAKLAGKSIRFF